MPHSARQGDLFSPLNHGSTPTDPHEQIAQLPQQLSLTADQLQDWQNRIHRHQAPLFKGEPQSSQQTQLFTREPVDHPAPAVNPSAALKPLQLRALPLSFWRWPESPHQGPAIYLVMDRPEHLPGPILLYVGETLAADQRWKGEHDCKAYLAAYGEALSAVGLTSWPNIRFWNDVPSATRARRRLEQQLIQTWLPPFNKETRERWATPFNAD